MLMSRPTNKEDLVAQARKEYDNLLSYVDACDDPEREFGTPTMNRNIGDVLCHLHQWHIMLKEWYKVGMAGGTPSIPAEGYNWRTVPALNKEIHRRYSNTPLSQAKPMLVHSHLSMMSIMNKHSNEELFTKKHYAWCGNNTLGAYLTSTTSSHYIWALRLIKKGLRD